MGNNRKKLLSHTLLRGVKSAELTNVQRWLVCLAEGKMSLPKMYSDGSLLDHKVLYDAAKNKLQKDLLKRVEQLSKLDVSLLIRELALRHDFATLHFLVTNIKCAEVSLNYEVNGVSTLVHLLKEETQAGGMLTNPHYLTVALLRDKGVRLSESQKKMVRDDHYAWYLGIGTLNSNDDCGQIACRPQLYLDMRRNLRCDARVLVVGPGLGAQFSNGHEPDKTDLIPYEAVEVSLSIPDASMLTVWDPSSQVSAAMTRDWGDQIMHNYDSLLGKLSGGQTPFSQLVSDWCDMLWDADLGVDTLSQCQYQQVEFYKGATDGKSQFDCVVMMASGVYQLVSDLYTAWSPSEFELCQKQFSERVLSLFSDSKGILYTDNNTATVLKQWLPTLISDAALSFESLVYSGSDTHFQYPTPNGLRPTKEVVKITISVKKAK